MKFLKNLAHNLLYVFATLLFFAIVLAPIVFLVMNVKLYPVASIAGAFLWVAFLITFFDWVYDD